MVGHALKPFPLCKEGSVGDKTSVIKETAFDLILTFPMVILQIFMRSYRENLTFNKVTCSHRLLLIQ